MAPSWGALIAFAAATRIATLLFGFLAAHHLPPLPWLGHGAVGPQSLVETFYRWDSTYYLKIAREGYDYSPVRRAGDGSMAGGGTAAFMPALSVGMNAAGVFGADLALAGLVIPNVAFTLGLAFFGRYLLLLGRDAGTVWRSCALLSAYPTAFFFSCPYQESLGFAGIAFALWAWQCQRPGLAAAGVFFASFARLTALAVPAGLLLEWLVNKLRRKPSRPLGGIALIALAWGLGVGLFMLHLESRFGEPLAHFKAHRMWDRQSPNPLNAWKTLKQIVDSGPLSAAGLSLALFAALGLRAWWKRGPFAGMLILVPLMQATFTGTSMSLERIVLASFPAFLDLAELLKDPRLFWAWMILSIVLQCILLDGYVHWQFVG